MNKALKISLFAILVATPMLADAAKTATPVTLVNDGNTPSTTQTVASTSYVQGAYNTLGTQVNAIINDTTVAAPAAGTTYTAISADKNVAENLIELDRAIRTAAGDSDNTYVTKTSAMAVVDETGGASGLQYISANGEKVGENLGILDNQVYKNATKIGIFNPDGNKNYISENASIQANIQSLDGQVKTNTDKIGAYDDTKSHTVIDDGSVFSNLHALDTQVAANALTGSLNQAAIGAVAELATAGGLIPAGTANLVTAVKAINTSLNAATGNSTIQEGVYTHTGDTVGGAIKALDTQVAANANKIGNTTMGTTNSTVTGAIAEMHGQTMQVATTWGSESTMATVHLFPQPN